MQFPLALHATFIAYWGAVAPALAGDPDEDADVEVHDDGDDGLRRRYPSAIAAVFPYSSH